MGVALLALAVTTGGPVTDSVYQYTAFEVDHDNDELVLTNAATGRERRGSSATETNVDERIACLPAYVRECTFEYLAIEENRTVDGVGSEHDFVYLDGTFYGIVEASPGSLAYGYERTDADAAFEYLAMDAAGLTDDERTAVERGRVITTHPLPNANRIVEHDGTYYTILETGVKSYGEGGSFCSSGGDGFCSAANDKRWDTRLRRAGLGLLGLLGIVTGGGNLLVAWSNRNE